MCWKGMGTRLSLFPTHKEKLIVAAVHIHINYIHHVLVIVVHEKHWDFVLARTPSIEATQCYLYHLRVWHSFSDTQAQYTAHCTRWLISCGYLIWSFLGISGCKSTDTKSIDTGFWPSWLSCEGDYFYWHPPRVHRHIASLVQILTAYLSHLRRLVNTTIEFYRIDGSNLLRARYTVTPA